MEILTLEKTFTYCNATFMFGEEEGTGSNPSSGKRFLLMEDCLYGDSNQDKIKWMREPASVLED